MPHRIRRLVSRIPAVRHVEQDRQKLVEVQKKISRESQGRALLLARADAVANRSLAYGEKNHFAEKVDKGIFGIGGGYGMAN